MLSEVRSEANIGKGKVLHLGEGKITVTLSQDTPLGQGGYAVVHKALWKDALGTQTVAVKRLRTVFSGEGKFVESFTDEFLLLQAIQHETDRQRLVEPTAGHTYWYPQVYGFVAEPDGLYIVMEYIEGENLAKKIERQQAGHEAPFSIQEVKTIMHDVFEAVMQAEKASTYTGRDSLFLGDIGGPNILYKSGRARSVDLGTAIMQREVVQILFGDTYIGRQGYCAPEQLDQPETPEQSPQHEPRPNAQTNVYQLGLFLYELLMHEKLINLLERNNINHPAGVDIAILTGGLWYFIGQALSERTDIPEDLKKVVLKSTQVNARNRYPSTEFMFNKFVDAFAELEI